MEIFRKGRLQRRYLAGKGHAVGISRQSRRKYILKFAFFYFRQNVRPDSRVVNFKSVAPLFPLRKSSAINSPRNSSAAVWVGTMTVAQADGGVDDNSLSKCDTSHFANAVARGSRESIKCGIIQGLQFLPLFSRSFRPSFAFCLT